jgi:hypothetical protein
MLLTNDTLDTDVREALRRWKYVSDLVDAYIANGAVNPSGFSG